MASSRLELRGAVHDCYAHAESATNGIMEQLDMATLGMTVKTSINCETTRSIAQAIIFIMFGTMSCIYLKYWHERGMSRAFVFHVSWLLAALAVAFLLACSSAFFSNSVRFGNYVATKDVSPRKTAAAFLMMSCDTRGFNVSRCGCNTHWKCVVGCCSHMVWTIQTHMSHLITTNPTTLTPTGFQFVCGDSNPPAMMWCQSVVSATQCESRLHLA